ncbi:MAG: hypothetical protein SFY80_13135 [Verrucomicrobiota bacterium]|nr:hypothetical protein [Verrucomicrobiota bacterium]
MKSILASVLFLHLAATLGAVAADSTATAPKTLTAPPAVTAAVKAPDTAVVNLSLVRDTRSALSRGHDFLLSQQGGNGSWKQDPAITGLVVYAFVLDPLYNPNIKSEMALARAITYLEDFVKPDGGIYRKDYAHYTTAVCLLAFSETKQAKYRDIIKNARQYLIVSQVDESENYKPDHPYYGGIGYGGDERPDLSNTHLAMEAIRAADRYEARFTGAVPEATGDTTIKQAAPELHWEKALIFLNRCQNVKAVNTMDYATDDGGFIYETGTYKAERSHSYGSMTYAGVKSLIYANVKKDDIRVQKAAAWIRDHYTWKENPGFGTTSLFYYFMTGAKSLSVLGDDFVVTPDGIAHNWREEIIRQILSLQGEDGSWLNSNGQYWENIKDLSTAYNLIALKYTLQGLSGE